MSSINDLIRQLLRLDGRGYKGYQSIRGAYSFPDFSVQVQSVQSDPFADPSRVCIRVPKEVTSFPTDFLQNRIRKIALADYLSRRLRLEIEELGNRKRGSGNSGRFFVDAGGQQILERSCVRIEEECLRVILALGLPAAGRRIASKVAVEMFSRELPHLIHSATLYDNLIASDLERHIWSVEDQEGLRRQLRNLDLVAFVANDSLLPRAAGHRDTPLLSSQGDAAAVRFQSPPELEVTLDRSHGGPIRGMGIPRGVTLITGGGFHGKSTLLKALERGVYNHIPGDGRELVVSLESTVKIRAEEGRSVRNVDISAFLEGLPFGQSTQHFSTQNASGSTSQASSIAETLEIGAEALLIDEDSSATNFMIRDARMQALVRRDQEPITPLLDQIRPLFEQQGVSSVLVMGGSGDFFEVSDQVIQMDRFLPQCVTRRAKQIVQEFPNQRRAERRNLLRTIRQRVPKFPDFHPRGTRLKFRVHKTDHIQIGKIEIDVSLLEQLVDPSQSRAIARAVYWMARNQKGQSRSLAERLATLEQTLEKEGLDCLSQHPLANLARPRLQEVAAAINRIRELDTEAPKKP